MEAIVERMTQKKIYKIKKNNNDKKNINAITAMGEVNYNTRRLDGTSPNKKRKKKLHTYTSR